MSKAGEWGRPLLAALAVLCCGTAAWADEPGGPQVSLQGAAGSAVFSEASQGDSHRYQEDIQVREGVTGGLDWLSANAAGQQWRWDSRLSMRHEYDFELSNHWEQEDFFYIKQEGALYPRYYDESNRFYDTPPRIYDLETTLRTLRGDFLVEAGSMVPDRPNFFAGYRHRSRDGETNSYWGGWLRNADPDDFILFVTPIQRERDEKTDTFYVGAKHRWGVWDVGFHQQFERFQGVDTYDEPGYYNNGLLVFTRYYRNQPRHDTWTSALTAARDALDGRLHFSADVQSIAVRSDSVTDVDSLTPTGARHYGEHSLNFLAAEHGGRNHSHSAGGRADYAPCDWARLWAGVRLGIAKAVGVSTRGEEGAEAVAVDENVATVDESWAFKSANRELAFAEEAGLEITALPKTRIALDVSLDQSRTKYHWIADVSGSRNSGNEGDWLWLSKIWENRNIYSASIRNWTWPKVGLWARYRYRVDSAAVDDQVDVANNKPGDPEYGETNTAFYYPGRIEDTRRETHEALAATTVRLTPRWSFRPQFEHRNSTYRVSEDAEPDISSFRSNTVSVGLMGSPVDPMTLSVNLSRQFALTSTRANSFSNTINQPNTTWYGGLTPAFNASNTAFSSEVEYRCPAVTTVLTSGIIRGAGDFDTRLVYGGVAFRGAWKGSKGIDWEFSYRYGDYDEDENGEINDYEAHLARARFVKLF